MGKGNDIPPGWDNSSYSLQKKNVYYTLRSTQINYIKAPCTQSSYANI